MSNFVFIGTGVFAGQIVQGLIKSGHKPELIISKTSSPKEGKQNSVRKIALENKIPFLECQNNSEFKVIIKAMPANPDKFAILCSFGLIISSDVISFFNKRVYNVHPSLLPKYRGSNPICSAIMKNEFRTGISIILLNEKMDAGNIIYQRSITIEENDDYEIVSSKLLKITNDFLREEWKSIADFESDGMEQNHELATFTSKISKDSRKIYWNNSSIEIKNLIRSLPPTDRAFTYWNEKMIFFENVSVSSESPNIPFGVVFNVSKKSFQVKCGQNSILIPNIMIEGKKMNKFGDFLNGHKEFQDGEKFG